ncbi:MAG: chemotaxis response regulator protein-glutamate methylesterase [Actinomycetota bacterium]
MSGPARILLCDDSVVIRGLLSKFIDAEDDLEVVGTAANGRIGVQKVASLQPDLLVLDVEMPEMNGLDALREIRPAHPDLPIIMFSTLTGRGASITLDALSAGASDYATKPSTTDGALDALTQVRSELIVKIRALLGSRAPGDRRFDRRPAARSSPGAAARSTAATGDSPSAVRLRTMGRPTPTPQAVVVGSSTGGPVALEQVLTAISTPLPVPMFVVQHMPEKFTKALADRLDKKSIHTVVEVDRPMTAEPGNVYVAAGGRHLRLAKAGAAVRAQPVDDPPVNSCRPSVDPLFESAAAIFGSHTLAVMLTGMGADGTDGTRTLASRGAPVIAQDEATSTVWGMPGSVVGAGLATEVLPLAQIGGRIAQLVGSSSSARRPVTAGSRP